MRQLTVCVWITDNCRMELHFPEVFTQTAGKLRKLLTAIIMSYRNNIPLDALDEYIPQYVADARAVWHDISLWYQEEYRCEDAAFCSSRKEARKHKAENTQRMNRVKAAKRDYEKAIKNAKLYLEIREKNRNPIKNNDDWKEIRDYVSEHSH